MYINSLIYQYFALFYMKMPFLTMLTVAIVAGMSSDVQTCAAERKYKIIY